MNFHFPSFLPIVLDASTHAEWMFYFHKKKFESQLLCIFLTVWRALMLGLWSSLPSIFAYFIVGFMYCHGFKYSLSTNESQMYVIIPDLTLELQIDIFNSRCDKFTWKITMFQAQYYKILTLFSPPKIYSYPQYYPYQ